MAQAKKSATKKPTVKATAARKPAAKKAPAKRATTVRKRTSAKSRANYTSFKLASAPKFLSLEVTEQTLYWAILGIIVLAFGAWVMVINDRVQKLYDQVDASYQTSIQTTTKK